MEDPQRTEETSELRVGDSFRVESASNLDRWVERGLAGGVAFQAASRFTFDGTGPRTTRVSHEDPTRDQEATTNFGAPRASMKR